MESEIVVLDPERQQKAKHYARIRRRFWLLETFIGAAYLLLWLLSGWAVLLREWLSGITENQWLLVPAFAAIFGGIYFVMTFPFGYYLGFVLPHRFGQSTQTLKSWVADQVKGLVVSIPIGLFVLEMVYLALRATGDSWWLWVAGGMLIFNVLLANLAPVLILPIFNKYVPLGTEHTELAERLMRLAERAKTRVRGVFKFDISRRTKAANAGLTGIGNTRRIILGDTLIHEFTTDEIETVLAHELGHHVNRDIPILIALSAVQTLGGLYLSSLALKWVTDLFNVNGPADVAGLPALGLVLGVYGLVTQPLSNAISRWRERKADEYALRVTGRKDAFTSAFTRLANQNLGEVDPEPWVVIMFYDHPPLGKRIEMARAWESK